MVRPYHKERAGDEAMQQKQFSGKDAFLQLDVFGMVIIVVLACVVLGTVGVLFSARRGGPEVERHLADLQAMKSAGTELFAAVPDRELFDVSLEDLGVRMGRTLDSSRYSVGIISEDQGAKLLVGVKVLSDPGVREFSEKIPGDETDLFWGGTPGSSSGKDGGELPEPLYPLKEEQRSRSPQWVYLLVREELRQ
jgi:hypothetical protein